MQRWSIRRKIMLITMSSLVLAIILISFDLMKKITMNRDNLVFLESNIREDYDDLLKNQIETAVSVIDNLRNQYEKENIAEEEIKLRIADVIRNMRYGKDGYFWIDTSDGTNVVLYGSETEGTNRFDFQDIKGKFVLKELIEKAKEGGGYTDYYFPKEGQLDPKPKRAYSLYYEKFDWVIGTGLYTDTIDELINNKTAEQNKLLREQTIEHLLITVGFFIFVIIGSLMTTRNIVAPVLFASSYAQAVSKGKFDKMIPVKYLKRGDEVGLLLGSLDEMNQLIRQSLQDKEEINRKLSKDNSFLNIILKSIGDGIIVVDRNSKVQIINETVSSQFRIDLCEIKGRSFDSIFSFKDMNKRAIEGRMICDVRTECLLCRKDIELFVDGSFYKLINDDQAIDGFVYVYHNISERLEKNREIEYLNYHDQLTGLHNRRFFEMKFNELLNEKYYPLGLIISDINALKLINDSLGHLMGDKLISTYANILKERFSDAETVARIGGDEFAILIPNITYETLFERIRKVGQELSEYRVGDLPVSAAFGCAVHTGSIFSFAETFKEADEKMYKDKMLGNNHFKNKILRAIIQRYFDLFPVKKNEVYMAIRLAKRFSLFLELDGARVKRIKKSALVYDIGNISIEYDYFEKKRRLTAKENEEIQTHPASAFHILKNISSYNDVAEIVLCHHENIDGSGYPRRLDEKQIPFESKVLALVTDYCAMRFERAYRPALSKEEAICEIKKKIGSRYDPEIASRFICMLKKYGEK